MHTANFWALAVEKAQVCKCEGRKVSECGWVGDLGMGRRKVCVAWGCGYGGLCLRSYTCSFLKP